MAVLADLRYSARSLTRTPGLALALLLTIALGIGSNASVQGFVRGLIARDLPIPEIDTLVSLFSRDPATPLGATPLSFDDYRALKTGAGVFAWLGAVRESLGTAVEGDRSAIRAVAAVSPEVARLFNLPLDGGVAISHRLWLFEYGGRADVRGEPIRLDGVAMKVAGVAPEWLDGLYLGRAVDLWTALDEPSLQPIDRVSRTFWVIGRLGPGVSAGDAQAAVTAARGDGGIGVLPYTGVTPDLADGLSHIATLLGAAAGAVFFIACANVASLLLGRASARARETSVRVALGASRGQLARQLLSDSILISLVGGAFGLLLAAWTAQIVPALFFDRDAEHLVFAPDWLSIVAAACACGAITIACGLMPMFEIRDDRPAAVLGRESAGPSIAMRRLRAGLVVAQMAGCSLLIFSAGFLLQGFRSALQTSIGHQLGDAVLVTAQSRPSASRDETSRLGSRFFHDVEQAARSVIDVTAAVWVARVPGTRPAWQPLRIDPPQPPVREVTMDAAGFTPGVLALITLPPVAGRTFGGRDTPASCRVVVVNDAAAAALFDGEAVGRALEDPAGERVEIIGVVAAREAERAPGSNRPTIYYYPSQTELPHRAAGPATFRVPSGPPPQRAALDAHVVSPGYFAAMALSPIAGRLFAEDPVPRGCRVAVINQEAAELYFGGHAVGGAVIDNAGRRTEIIGVVHTARLGTLQRRADPAIYFPMTQDAPLRMTLILGTADTTDATLAELRRRVEEVPGRGPAPVVVQSLDAHLSRTALAPLRIAATLVGASAATAVALGVLGLYGALSDAARQRRREIAVRIALGAQGWRVVRQVVAEGGRLAGAGTVVGVLGSLGIARLLASIAPAADAPAAWVWLAAPLVLTATIAIASVVPARRASRVDPLTIGRDDG